MWGFLAKSVREGVITNSVQGHTCQISSCMQIEALPAMYKEIQRAQGTGTALCGPWCDTAGV